MPSPPIPDSPLSSVFPPAESLIVGSLPLFVSFDSMFVGINLFIWLCPSSLIFPCPLLDLSRQGYAFYQPLRVRQRGFKLQRGWGFRGGGGGGEMKYKVTERMRLKKEGQRLN